MPKSVEGALMGRDTISVREVVKILANGGIPFSPLTSVNPVMSKLISYANFGTQFVSTFENYI